MGKKKYPKNVKRCNQNSNPEQSPEELIAKAVEAANQFETAQALHFYQSALTILEKERLPKDEHRQLTLEALQASAFILLEQGKIKNAQRNLQKAVVLSPNQGHEKYMYLAQLAERRDAVDLYRRGIAVLNATLDGDPSTKNDYKRALSNAFCAVADLYMTDLCDEEDAETCCREAVSSATDADDTNPQAWLSAANFQTVRAENEAAKASLEKCLSLYWPEVERTIADLQIQEGQQLPDGNGDHEADDGNDEEPLNRLDLEEISGIPYEAHIQMARMMMELDMYERAAEVLEALLEEDDECAEIFYLLSVIGQRLWQDTDPDRLRHYVKTAKQMCLKEGDTELGDEMGVLLTSLPPAEDEDEEEDDDDDNFDVIPSSSEEEEEGMDIG